MDTVDTWSHPRRQMLKWSHLIPVKEDYIPSGMCRMDYPWNKVAAPLLNISLVVIWENVLVKRTNSIHAMLQVFERYRRAMHKI